LLLRARIQQEIGHPSDARATLRRLAAIDRARKLDRGEYDPRLIAWFAAERRLAGRGQATLTVQGEGDLTIDGVRQLDAPCTIRLPPGEHLVRMGSGEGAGVTEVVVLPANGARTVRLAVPILSTAAPGPAELRATARADGAGSILIGRLLRNGALALVTAELVDTASGRVLAQARGFPEVVAIELAARLRGGPAPGNGLPANTKR
jgi:hypothetical protein